MGTSHVSTFRDSVPGAVVTAVTDVDPASAEEVASGVGAELFASGTELIASDQVDAVVISSPDPTHEQLVLSCLAVQKPVLCEKPLAADVEGTRRIVDAEVALGRRLVQVGFMRRYDAAYVQLRDLLRTGAIGSARAVHCIHRNAVAHPSATSEGIIVNSMIHELDTVAWLLDDALAAVTVSAPARSGGGLMDLQFAVLETSRGVLVTVEVFVNAGYGYDVQCEVVCDRGTARLTPPYGLAVRRDGMDGVMVSADFVGRFADAYRIELAAWVDGVLSGTVEGPTAWDGHRASVAAAAGVESLYAGGWVSIPLPDIPALYACTTTGG